MSVKDDFQAMICFIVGSGDMIHFWHDTWVGSTPFASQFPKLYRCTTEGSAMTSLYLSKVDNRVVWGPTFRRNLLKIEMTQLNLLLSLLEDVYVPLGRVDTRVWEGTVDGFISLKYFFSTSLTQLPRLPLPLRTSGSLRLLRGLWLSHGWPFLDAS